LHLAGAALPCLPRSAIRDPGLPFVPKQLGSDTSAKVVIINAMSNGLLVHTYVVSPRKRTAQKVSQACTDVGSLAVHRVIQSTWWCVLYLRIYPVRSFHLRACSPLAQPQIVPLRSSQPSSAELVTGESGRDYGVHRYAP
jgi:hypothetical protein